MDRGAAGPTAEGTGCDGAAQDAADQRASLPILGLPSALAWPLWRWRGAHRGSFVSRGQGIYVRWLCLVSRAGSGCSRAVAPWRMGRMRWWWRMAYPHASSR